MAAQDINCDGERAFLLQAWLVSRAASASLDHIIEPFIE